MAGRYLSRFAALSLADKVDTGRLLALLAAAELSVRFMPLPGACRLFGLRLATGGSPHGGVSPSGATGSLSGRELRRVQLLRRLADHWPFGTGPCLRRSLVLGRTLRRYGPELRLGAAIDGTDLRAHAWVEIDGWSVDPEAASGHVALVP